LRCLRTTDSGKSEFEAREACPKRGPPPEAPEIGSGGSWADESACASRPDGGKEDPRLPVPV